MASPLDWLNGISTATQVVGSLISSIFNKNSQDTANSINKQYAEDNISIQQGQLDEQKFLNRNQIQLQAADAQKAGINPLAMNSSALSSGSYSSVNPNQTASQFDVSGVNNAISSVISELNSNRRNKDTLQNTSDNLDKQLESNFNLEKLKMHNEIKLEKMRLEHESSLEKSRQEHEILMQNSEHEHSNSQFEKDYQLRKSIADADIDDKRDRLEIDKNVSKYHIRSEKIDNLNKAYDLFKSLRYGVDSNNSGEIGSILNSLMGALGRSYDSIISAINGSHNFDTFCDALGIYDEWSEDK